MLCQKIEKHRQELFRRRQIANVQRNRKRRVA